MRDKDFWKGLTATLVVMSILALALIVFVRGAVETAKDVIK